MPVSCRPATAASLWRISSFSTSANSSTGMWSWRCRRATSCRQSSAVSASSAGRRGCRRTGPAEKRIAATRASIRPNGCGASAGGHRDAEEENMADISIEAVTGKLNRVGYEAFMQALRQAKRAGNRHVELAHWLFQLLQKSTTDLSLTVDHFKLERAKLGADLAKILEGLHKR